MRVICHHASFSVIIGQVHLNNELMLWLYFMQKHCSRLCIRLMGVSKLLYSEGASIPPKPMIHIPTLFHQNL